MFKNNWIRSRVSQETSFSRASLSPSLSERNTVLAGFTAQRRGAVDMVCTSSYASAGKFSFCHHDIGIAPSEEQGGAHQHRDYGALFLDMENIYVPPIQTSSSPKEFLSRESGELGKLWKLRRLIRMGARPVLPIAPPKRSVSRLMSAPSRSIPVLVSASI